MSRRRVAEKREILPDPKYGNQILAKFINMLMRGGKKSVAEKIVYGALNEIGEKGKGDALELFTKALDNVRPLVEVKSRRVGGSFHLLPSGFGPRLAVGGNRWMRISTSPIWWKSRPSND